MTYMYKEPLREEYTKLLQEQERKPTKERSHQIEELEMKMRDNLKKHLALLQDNKNVIKEGLTASMTVKRQYNYRKVYNDMIAIYREANELVQECRYIKKAMRQQGGKRT